MGLFSWLNEAYHDCTGFRYQRVYNQIKNKSYQGANIPEITTDYSSLFEIYQKLPEKEIPRAEQTLRELKARINCIKNYGPCEKFTGLEDKLTD